MSKHFKPTALKTSALGSTHHAPISNSTSMAMRSKDNRCLVVPTERMPTTTTTTITMTTTVTFSPNGIFARYNSNNTIGYVVLTGIVFCFQCSAAALDILATMYQNDILPHFLPILKEVLMSQDWTQRECGILALGAVAEGCASGMDAHLVELVPFLVSNLRDQRVRSDYQACHLTTVYSRLYVRSRVGRSADTPTG